MDRRMYRGNMGSNYSYGRNSSRIRRNEPIYDEGCDDYSHEDKCDKHSHEDMCDRRRHEDKCDKDRFNGDFDRFPIGMCYVPWQCFRDLFENEFVALAKGTLFKELDLDWYGRGCK